MLQWSWLRPLVTSAISVSLSFLLYKPNPHDPYPLLRCSLYKLNLLCHEASSTLPIASLLLRVYGAGTEKLIDRSVELSLLDHLAVHAPEIAPIMYVAFANGRLEQFIEGARTLQAADMRVPSTSVLIAQKMARLHSLPLPPSASPQPAVWGLICNWLNGERDCLLLEQGATAPAVLQQRMQTVLEAMALSQELQPLLQADATVLCHNDLLCGNILQEIGGDRLYLIDYECASCVSGSGLVSVHPTLAGMAPPTPQLSTWQITSSSGKPLKSKPPISSSIILRSNKSSTL
jgi:hypothetical protein